jgi:hypothetical protein
MRKWIIPMLVAVLMLSVAAPAMAKGQPNWRNRHYPHGKKVFVQRPYTAKGRYVVSKDDTATIKTWGYVKPRVASTDEATLTVRVQKRVGNKWAARMDLEQKATLFNKSWAPGKTMYKAEMKIPAGKYRMRARLVYKDVKGIERVKWSSFKYFRVVTKK